MTKAPAFQFYPNDWMHDLDEHPLEIEGAWIRICCKLWWSEEHGKLTKTITQWARILRATEQATREILLYLKDEQIGDIIFSNNGKVTVMSRRMLRDEKERENNRLRQNRFREKRDSNAPITPLSQPSSSSSSPSKKVKKEDMEEIREYIRLTTEQYTSLKSQFEKEKLEWMFDKLDFYLSTTKKKYTGAYGFFKKGSWLIEEMEKHFNLSPKDSGLCEHCGKGQKYLGGLCIDCHYRKDEDV